MPQLQPQKLHLIAILILLIGCGVGGVLYWSGGKAVMDDDDGDSSLQTIENSKQVQRQVEMYSGKMGLLMDNLRNAWADWQHPRPIGITIAGASGIAALLVFFVARSRREG